ncbi:MAG TPA: hypothetical protein PLH98_11555 [Ruminococcus flavefaciens]|nr:hypothetical protein [Ruminococcus flavefaciens]
MMSVFERDSEYENQLDRQQANQDDDHESADAAYDSLEEEAYVNGYATTDFGLGYRYGIC